MGRSTLLGLWGAGVLAEENSVIRAAAARAGISPRALYDRLKRYGIDKAEFCGNG